jgi:hypothetical protein
MHFALFRLVSEDSACHVKSVIQFDDDVLSCSALAAIVLRLGFTSYRSGGMTLLLSGFSFPCDATRLVGAVRHIQQRV